MRSNLRVLLIAAIAALAFPAAGASAAADADADLKAGLLGAWSLPDRPDCRAGQFIFAGDDFLMVIDRRPGAATKFPAALPYRVNDDAVEFPAPLPSLRSLRFAAEQLTYRSKSGSHTIVRCSAQDLAPGDRAIFDRLIGTWTSTTKPDCQHHWMAFSIDGQYREEDGEQLERGVYWVDSGALHFVRNHLVANHFRGDKPPPTFSVRFEARRMFLDDATQGAHGSADRCPP